MATDTSSARASDPLPRMQVTIYPQISEPVSATRNRSPQLWKNSANKLRSYESLPKLARSMERMRSRSESLKRRTEQGSCILVFFILMHFGGARKPSAAKKRRKRGPSLDKDF